MFTGLVETIGSIEFLSIEPPGKRLTVATLIWADPPQRDAIRIGDSIAINGCCLTVVRVAESLNAAGQLCVEFEAGEETLSRTNLGELDVGSQVNLERSLAVGDRVGGHFVTGHIDALGTLVQRRDDPPWAQLTFNMPVRLANQIAAQGSITVDGVSLTVVDVAQDSFTAALIPHTLSVTTLGQRRIGDRVNLETDVLAKYVHRCWQSFAQPNDASNPPANF